MRRNLTGREYKLLLEPAKFAGNPNTLAEEFCNTHLMRATGAILGRSDDGKPVFSGAFGEPRERVIRFWDTGDCLLGKNDFALRERKTVAKSGKKKTSITLKLRLSDIFVAGSAVIPSKQSGVISFEEDIAPLPVDYRKAANAASDVPKASAWSRFSLSITLEDAWDSSEPDLDQVMALFPGLHENLHIGMKRKRADNPLESGPIIRELAFKGPSVRFDDGCLAAFTLTLWYLDDSSDAPSIAEISYKYEASEAKMSGEVARRARLLFLGLQTELGAYVNAEHSSKTALVLPQGCVGSMS